MDSFYHNSRISVFRSPLGARPTSSPVRLFCRAEGRYLYASVTLCTWTESGVERRIPMQRVGGGFMAVISASDKPGLIWYRFLLELPDGERVSYGGRSGAGKLSADDPGSFRITVYDGAYETPQPFREGICYQIFPDRFCRSSWEDFQSRKNAHTDLGRAIRIHDRWNEEPCSGPAPGKKDYLPDDFFGGDLNGIREKLDYLRSLGVTYIYLNPIFSSSSNHRYNTADYMHIDPILGTDADYEALCREADDRGIRIITDGVFSHTGSDSIYFNREGRYGENTGAYRDVNSPYRSWYRFAPDGQSYECWWGFETLPNVEEMNPDYTRFITGEDGVLSRWARAGSTSWRLDVADELPDAFIRKIRKRIKKNDPRGVLIGEVWEEPTAKQGPEGRRGYCNGDELDSVMNYCFRNAVLDFLTEKKNAPELKDELLYLEEQYPKPFYMAALNLLGSHDVVRPLTVLAGAPDRDSLTREEQRVWQPTEEARALARLRMVLAEALQVFLPGVPCLYYGDEAGVEGMADPFNRKPFPWGKEDPMIFEQTKKLFNLRANSVALKRGTCRMAAPDSRAFVAVRAAEGERMMLLINASDAERRIILQNSDFREGISGGDGTLTGSDWTDDAGNTRTLGDGAEVKLGPMAYTVLRECPKEKA